MSNEQDSANAGTTTASDVHTIEAKDALRRSLTEDVERFLAKGGTIEDVPRHVRADPPKRPENNYGRGSI